MTTPYRIPADTRDIHRARALLAIRNAEVAGIARRARRRRITTRTALAAVVLAIGIGIGWSR